MLTASNISYQTFGSQTLSSVYYMLYRILHVDKIWRSTGIKSVFIFRMMSKFTYSSFCSRQSDFSSRAEMCFIPESPISFPLRLNSIRCVGFDVRADARSLQPFCVTLLSLSLQWERMGKLS